MRNQKSVLVPAGRWEFTNFTYGKAKCMCCGRPIWRQLHLTNQDHAAKVANDPAYAFPETIIIGSICGPDLFEKSCVGFYDDPAMEWARQYSVLKSYVDYVLVCVKGRDIWHEMTPAALREAVDTFLEGKWKETDLGRAGHTGNWWRIRDAKKQLLSVKRNRDRVPSSRLVQGKLWSLLRTCQSVGLVAGDWRLTPDGQIETLRAS